MTTERDDIAQAVLDGKPLTDILVIDAHGHIGGYFGYALPRSDAAGIVNVLDATGINMIAISCTMAAVGVDRTDGNNMTIDAVRSYPDRFIGYCALFPDNPQDNLDELKRCEAAGLRAIKIHHSHGQPYTHRAYRMAYEYADERRMPILAHTWVAADCEEIAELAADYPNITWIAAHSPTDFDAFVKLANDHANVCLELCYSLSPYGLVEFYVHEVGADRVLFGSDCAFHNAATSLGRVAMAKIDVEDKLKLLGRNAQRVFNLAGVDEIGA